MITDKQIIKADAVSNNNEGAQSMRTLAATSFTQEQPVPSRQVLGAKYCPELQLDT